LPRRPAILLRMHVIGTAGHVDHGKSALVQRLTGIDPDRFAEEKRRGLTIDLGFAWLPLPSGREIGIVDVPGHERFIKNMLAGAGGVSICLFVVAANEGWKPQSAEHLSVLDVLGVRHGVVALTKADLVDDDLLELATAEVEEHIANSSLAGARIIPCSVVTGMGLDDLVAELDSLVTSVPPAPDRGRPRLWIDRVFTISGAGTVVTGTLVDGSLAAGDEVEVVGPGSRRERRARVRTIQSHKKEVSSIEPGNRVALNLAGMEKAAAERGDAVVHPGTWSRTARLDVVVRVLPSSISGREHVLTEKGSHLLYVGSAETPVRLKLLDADELKPGSSGYAQAVLRDPLPLGRGDRFVLRDAGRVLTFGGGEVLDPAPPPARRNDPDRLALFRALDGADDRAALRALVDAAGEMKVDVARARTGTAEADGVEALGPLLVSAARLDALKDEARSVLARYHEAHPLERGMPRELMRNTLGLEPDVFDALGARLDDVVESGRVVHLGSHRVLLDPEQKRAHDDVLQKLDSFSPPPPKELGVDMGLLRSMVEAGELVPIGDFYFTAERARAARALVRAAIDERGPLTVAEIRDLLGTSRRYAVPLCEWLDGTGATVRRGDVRLVGPNP
jgi:selenocysteine-specific elongation factor